MQHLCTKRTGEYTDELMKTLKLATIFIACLSVLGCTSKSLFNAMQENRRQACIKQPTIELQQACIKDFEESYEDYERKRQEAISKQHPAR
jgi:hypothetical protein